MIDFSKAYSRADFVNYLRRDFLPDDFEQEESNVPFWAHMNYASAATCLGKSKTLDLVVYEIKHTSRHDARVGLSKDAFRMLAGEKQSRALVIFVPEDDANNYRFSLIEIQLSIGENDSNVTRTYSNPRRYSYYLGKGIACYTPNKYLNELGRVKDVKDLFDRFSVEVLTKAFYQELSDWYAWAIKVISFPNDITKRTDDKLHNHEGAIRLITRLIFVWFLKERKLIPWQFFDQEYIANHLIKGFNPHKIDNLFGKSEASVYYRAILQNLFFAMLNCPITKDGSTELTERRFKDNRSQFDDNKLMRYRDEFNDPDEFLRLANETVPFLNGGLFDCLDEKRTGMYYDGFSERKESMAQLIVPDYLFFGEEAGKNIDLSEFYGDANKKKVSARGIIDILKRYNFTVEENMPFDKDVSLDPELLGKCLRTCWHLTTRKPSKPPENKRVLSILRARSCSIWSMKVLSLTSNAQLVMNWRTNTVSCLPMPTAKSCSPNSRSWRLCSRSTTARFSTRLAVRAHFPWVCSSKWYISSNRLIQIIVVGRICSCNLPLMKLPKHTSLRPPKKDEKQSLILKELSMRM